MSLTVPIYCSQQSGSKCSRLPMLNDSACHDMDHTDFKVTSAARDLSVLVLTKCLSYADTQAALPFPESIERTSVQTQQDVCLSTQRA